ncbi:MAG: PSD1 and planctomycete cytochrome C domain-containing protein, partial [Planctomycetaceae bacterium]
MRPRSTVVAYSIAAIMLAACIRCIADDFVSSSADEGIVRVFEAEVRPILVARCTRCHGPDEQKAGLRLDSLVGMLRGGDSGPAIVPGDPDAINLLAAVRHESWEMTPDGRLDDRAIRAIEAWVAAGSPWPGERPAAELMAEGLPEPEAGPSRSPIGPPQRKLKGVVTEADRSAWAYQPVRRPAPPQQPVREGLPDGILRASVANPVDFFIVARLAEAGIEPLPEADRATLVRRVFLDLVGLPPTPADVESFLADPLNDAFERLVDRLLADPRHGERWARHWLDLARYSESDGFRQDAFRPTAWRYRDYVIDSFNADKPFDRFIEEQLAGDELFPHDLEALVATGFLRQTPYEYNQVDAETQWADILGDATDVTADVFLAMGMGCAKCHDHKFDPVSQRDYFALQAFFAGIAWRDALPPRRTPSADHDSIERGREIERELTTIREGCRDPAAWKGLARFPPEIQEVVFTPAAARSPHEQQIAELAARQLTFDPTKLPDDLRETYERLAKELSDLRASGRTSTAEAVLAIADVGPEPAVVRIPGRSDDGPIDPRIPEVLGGTSLAPLPRRGEDGQPLTSGRRSALACWIASPDTPLTARVFVNRLWQWHFGRGLVATTSDFGVLGEPATHPELLDWLAAEFVASGWSVRHVDRLIVTSAAYRRASFGEAPAAIKADPANRLVWRHDSRRLDADQVRDAALAISGELEEVVHRRDDGSAGAAGGPSVPGSKPRRAIYTRSIRNTREPLADAFDAPDGYGSCPERNCTTTPTQALYLANGEWMLERARRLALAIERSLPEEDASSTPKGWIERAAAEVISRVTGRSADEDRLREATAFLERQREFF